MTLKNDNKIPQERIVHGILSGIHMRPKPLYGSTLSDEESLEYFRQQRKEVEQGLELIPGQIRIRYVNPTDIKRFGDIVFHFHKNIVPKENEILIEGESRGPFVVSDEFELVLRTLLALRLLKSGPVFLKNIYSFPRDSLSRDEIIFGMPLIFRKDVILGYTLFPDDKIILAKILNDIKDIDFNKEIPFRIACDRFSSYYHDKSPEDKLLDLCIGFEALFCKGERYSPMGQVIGLACSMLLGEDNKQRKNISDVLENSFCLRNKIVHGRDYNQIEISENLPVLENYIRKAILRLNPVNRSQKNGE